jgi:hypothetical protein
MPAGKDCTTPPAAHGFCEEQDVMQLSAAVPATPGVPATPLAGVPAAAPFPPLAASSRLPTMLTVAEVPAT